MATREKDGKLKRTWYFTSCIRGVGVGNLGSFDVSKERRSPLQGPCSCHWLQHSISQQNHQPPTGQLGIAHMNQAPCQGARRQRNEQRRRRT